MLIEEKGCVVDGVELDSADYKLAQKNLRNVYELNIETDSLDLLTSTYDYIYFGDVIEHLVHPVASLERIHHLLKPDGQLVFSIPNMAHLSTRLMLLQGDFEYGETGLLDKTHLHFYTTKEVERILVEAGYNLVNFDPVLKDLPEEVIEQELRKVGLTGSDEYLRMMRSSEASIYQIVGAAKTGSPNDKTVRAKLAVSSPVDIFQVYLRNTQENYQQQLEEKNQHIVKLEAYAKDVIKRYEEAVTESEKKDKHIAEMKQEPLRRFADRVQQLKSKRR
jgi:hypothetical protein